MKKWNSPLRDFVSGFALRGKMELFLGAARNEVPFSSSPFLFKGLRFERSLLGGKVPC